MVQTILREAGHTVHAASNGEGALAQLTDTPCDLLVTDMHMPVMDGITLMSQCRDLYPGLQVIAISGGDFAGDASRLADAGMMGAVETVQKPFNVDDLCAAVDRALNRAHSEMKPIDASRKPEQDA
jgi:DNA-binding NtrC family response regulator